MKSTLALAFFLAVTLACPLLNAQELPKPAKPEKEHEWLEKFVGTWDFEGKSTGENGVAATAVMKWSKLGNFWVVNHSETNVMGMKVRAIQMIGYDSKKKKFVGTWTDSSSNYLWHYEGTLNKAGNRLTLNTKGPSMTGDGEIVNYRDAYEFKKDDTIVAESWMQDENGKWKVFMSSLGKRRQEK